MASQTVQIIFTADDKDLANKLSKLSGAFAQASSALGGASGSASKGTGMFSKLAGALGSVGKIAGGIVAAQIFGKLASGITNALGLIPRMALKAVASAQAMQISFETLLTQSQMYRRNLDGTYTAINTFANAQDNARRMTQDLVKELDRISVISPFERKDIDQMAKYALVAGLGTDETVKFTEAFVNYGAALGLGSERLAFAADQFLQLRKVMFLSEIDLRQLRRLGFDVARIVQNELGMSVAEFNAQVKQSPQLMDDLFNAFAKFAGETTTGAAKKLALSMGGLVNTAKDIISVGARQLFLPLADAVTPSIGKMFENFNEILQSGQLIKIGEAIPELLFGAIGVISGDKLGIIDLIEGMSALGISQETINSVVAFSEAVVDLSQKVQSAFQEGGLAGVFQVFATEFGTGVKDAIVEAARGIPEAINTFFEFETWGIQNFTQPLLTFIGDTLGWALTEGLKLAGHAMAAAGVAMFQAAFNDGVPAIEQYAYNISKFVTEKLVEFLQSLMSSEGRSGVINFLVGLGSILLGAVALLARILVNVAKGIIDGIITGLYGEDWQQQLEDWLIKGITGAINASWSAFVSLGSSILDAIWQGLTSEAERVDEIAKGMDKLGQSINTVGDEAAKAENKLNSFYDTTARDPGIDEQLQAHSPPPFAVALEDIGIAAGKAAEGVDLFTESIRQMNIAADALPNTADMASAFATFVPETPVDQGFANAQRAAMMYGMPGLFDVLGGGTSLTPAEQEASRKQREDDEKAAKKSYDKMVKAAEDFANKVGSAVETAFSRMQDVAPEGMEGLFDFGGQEPGEFGRRLMAIADGGMAGFDQQWAEQFKQNLGENGLYQPLLDAINAGDSGAMQAEAGRLLSQNMADVLATGIADHFEAELKKTNLLNDATQKAIDYLSGLGYDTTSLEGPSAEVTGGGVTSGNMGDAAGGGLLNSLLPSLTFSEDAVTTAQQGLAGQIAALFNPQMIKDKVAEVAQTNQLGNQILNALKAELGAEGAIANIFDTAKVATVDLATEASTAFETARDGTDKWLERVEILADTLGIVKGHLENIDTLMDGVAPPYGGGGLPGSPPPVALQNE